MTKKITHQKPLPKSTEVAAKSKHAPKSHKPKGPPAEMGSAYAPASPKLDDWLAKKSPKKVVKIDLPNTEFGLMQSAIWRLDRALGAYEDLITKLESMGTTNRLVENLASPGDIRRSLMLAAKDVQGQLNSGHAHADDWFKGHPHYLETAKSGLREQNARFEALTQRANRMDPSLNIPLHPAVLPRI